LPPRDLAVIVIAPNREKQMLLPIFLSLQAIEPPADLASKILPDRCRAASIREDEVVVCGRRDGQSPYRIGPLSPTPPALPDAEFNISESAKVKLSAEQGEIGGIPTNRAMISLKIKF
jgi:hypothetical protein